MSSAWDDPRRVLARHGLSPKKAFSQNFLVSRQVVEGIVRAIAPREGERVIELGPGLLGWGDAAARDHGRPTLS